MVSVWRFRLSDVPEPGQTVDAVTIFLRLILRDALRPFAFTPRGELAALADVIVERDAAGMRIRDVSVCLRNYFVADWLFLNKTSTRA